MRVLVLVCPGSTLNPKPTQGENEGALAPNRSPRPARLSQSKLRWLILLFGGGELLYPSSPLHDVDANEMGLGRNGNPLIGEGNELGKYGNMDKQQMEIG